jgi:hypothetical protein
MTYETIWEFRTSRFLITFDVAPEDIDPADTFEFEDDIAAVRNGDVEFFQARVAVHLIDASGERGNIVGADYLGGCAYATFDEFWRSHFESPYESRNTLASKAKGVCYCDYFPSMVREAVSCARQHLADLPKLRAA